MRLLDKQSINSDGFPCLYKTYGNKLYFVLLCSFLFLFVSHHNLYYCGIKKLNSISDLLLHFSYLWSSLSQTIYKGTVWHSMKLVWSDFAPFFPPFFSPIPLKYLHFLIFSISYCHSHPWIFFFFFLVSLCFMISKVEKEWVKIQPEKLKAFFFETKIFHEALPYHLIIKKIKLVWFATLIVATVIIQILGNIWRKNIYF